jgi:hypothetical protein
MVHTQAAIQPSAAPIVVRLSVFCFAFASLNSIGCAFGQIPNRDTTPVLGSVIVSPQAVKIEAVSKVSTLRKMGVVARVARDQAGRSRTLSAIMSGVRTTLRSFWHAIHQLWLEVTGTLFLFIAAFGAIALFREYTKYQAGHTTASRLAVVVCFTLTFAWFGLSSFWRVRRKGQRH